MAELDRSLLLKTMDTWTVSPIHDHVTPLSEAWRSEVFL